MKIRGAHQSSRYDRAPTTLARAARRLRRRTTVRTWTEVAEEHRSGVLAASGVVVRRGQGARNADDCGIEFDRSEWKLIARHDDVIAETGGGKGQAPVTALTLILGHRFHSETILFTVAHMPTEVQARTGWRRDKPAKVAAYKTALRRWPAAVDRYAERYAVTGRVVWADWNLDHRLPWVRQTLREAFGLGSIWAGRNPKRGTHGDRLIDAALTDLRVVRADVLRADGSSDHRAVTYTLATHRRPKRRTQ